jgi:hypothetical protein
MFETKFPLFMIILIFNSLITISLILSQNENSKDTIFRTEISNPLENLTWFCVIFEFSLLLLKTKNPSSSIYPISYYSLILKGSILYPKYSTCFSTSFVICFLL